jgi:hypothetical protein
LQEYVICCRDEVNKVRHHLGNVEKGQKELGDTINKLIEDTQKVLGDKIDKLIEDSKIRWLDLIRMRNNDKDKASKITNDHSEMIEQLIERLHESIVQPLTYQKPPTNPNSSNTSH